MSYKMSSRSTVIHLRADSPDLPDLTDMLHEKRVIGQGSVSFVYRCRYAQGTAVAVKAIDFPKGFDTEELHEFERKAYREIGVWKRLNHPNIVPLLGRASGKDFGSDYTCMVLAFMPNGTLFNYVKRHSTTFSFLDRIKLIKGVAAGVEYLHSLGIVHGDLHPGNILIDDEHQPRLTDFGLSQTVDAMPDNLAYLYTGSTRAGAILWAAPELVFPGLYPELKFQVSFQNDIYSLGSIIFLILSGQYPWKNRAEAEDRLKELKNPSRPAWPTNIPDGVWDFLERCWSPNNPGSRPSAREVLSFCTDRLERLLLPDPTSDINVVLFGLAGPAKSSIINLLAGEQVAPVSSGELPCAERPRCYPISINSERNFCLWDTVGYTFVNEESACCLSPYEEAYTVLRNLPGGVSLILLCTDAITPSLGHLYWLISHFFYGGHAPIAFVVTHSDIPDEKWWTHNEEDISKCTTIPIEYIRHARVTTDPDFHDQSKRALKELLQYATGISPAILRPDFSSYTTAPHDLVLRCGLTDSHAMKLMEKFGGQPRRFDVGKTGRTSSIMNRVVGLRVAETRPNSIPYPHSLLECPKMVEINCQNEISSLFFAQDGEVVLGGGGEVMLRRWVVGCGHEVGKPIQDNGAKISATVLSPDGKWLVCGSLRSNQRDGKGWILRVWDAQTQANVLDVDASHTDIVSSVDISHDSTKVASGSLDKLVFIRSIRTGERLLGPLQHDSVVVAVQFSPNSGRIAVATAQLIHIYDSTNGKRLLDIPFGTTRGNTRSPFAWFADGRQLYTVTYGEAKCFDTSSGSLLNKWSIPNGISTSTLLACNQKFSVVLVQNSVSFWDVSTQKQIGTILKHSCNVSCFALSPYDDCLATCEENGKITLWNLRDILPDFYFTVNLPILHSISNATFKSWVQGDFVRVEGLLTEEIIYAKDTSQRAQALAYRSLVRSRTKKWISGAIIDSKKSIEVQPTLVGHITHALAHIGNGEHKLAMRLVDLVFTGPSENENEFLLLIKAIIMFECGKYNDAISRVEDLINIVNDGLLCKTVLTRMFLLRGNMLMRNGDNKRAIEFFKNAQNAPPFQQSPHLVAIWLMFGWEFDRLPLVVRLLHLYKTMHTTDDTGVVDMLSTMVEVLDVSMLTTEMTADLKPEVVQTCLQALEGKGNAAMQSKNAKDAIILYSTAISFKPSDPTALFNKRSRARATLELWDDALKDADEAINADSKNPWGYERRHAALHGLKRFDKAIDAFNDMLSLMEGSANEEMRQSAKKYVPPSKSKKAIDRVIPVVQKTCPFVLIDVQSGRLLDESERTGVFKSEPQFTELVSSMTEELDEKRILRVVKKYFEYVTFSHVWGGKEEPSFQDVDLVKSIWDLPVDSSPLNQKLRKFCEVVRNNKYRWAWSDTCCIDKMINTVLHQSVTMMYKWYEASATTFVFLADVGSPSVRGSLTKSLWMTRAWTGQELLAPKAIRFYNRDWRPYLNDMRSNHKESPVIIQELSNAIGIPSEKIVSFSPDDLTLSVREKLRLASTRKVTREEDIAYSLIGIFKSDIRPYYGEGGKTALGHLLEEIVNRLGDLTVLDWNGKSSPYNSCLPAALAVYASQTPCTTSSAIEGTTLDLRIEALRTSLSREEAMAIHNKVAHLHRVRFANRRLHLPCIVFRIKRLSVAENIGDGQGTPYRAQVSRIGQVEFQTWDNLSSADSRELVFVHPWIRSLCDPLDDSESSDEDEHYDEELGSDSGCRSFSPLPLRISQMDSYTEALRLISHLQQPFHALLLQQQSGREFKRIAADHEFAIPGLELKQIRNIRTRVMEIL